ncbi:MAG: hypothetical protein KBC91_05595 [Candidatus Omnitrophica bacterium]|nr:hypothetical protein [Candidatus Omnitrophota bacterium]
METEKRSTTVDTVVSEVFKWVGFAWTGMCLFTTVQFLIHVSEGEKVTRLEYNMQMYQNALDWAIVAVPAFVASYFGKK